MSEFLMESELTETKAFIRSFVKEIAVRPGKAVIHYTIPTPLDNEIDGADIAAVALSRRVMKSVTRGGPILTIDRTVFEMWLGAPGQAA